MTLYLSLRSAKDALALLILDEVFPGAVPQKYIAGDRVSVNSIGEKFDYFKLVKEGEK